MAPDNLMHLLWRECAFLLKSVFVACFEDLVSFPNVDTTGGKELEYHIKYCHGVKEFITRSPKVILAPQHGQMFSILSRAQFWPDVSIK